MKLAPLYKRSTTGKISFWEIEVEDNKFRTISGFTDGDKVTSAWTECVGKNKGKSNSTDGNKQALQQAKSLWKKRTEKGAFEKISDIDNTVFFKPMLAHELKDYIDDIEFPIDSQPKLDGVRNIVEIKGQFTRNGKKSLSSPHIYEALKPLFDQYPDLIFDGELYCDKYANDFNSIISLVRKTKPEPEDLVESAKHIEYHIYDLPSCDGTFRERQIELLKLKLPDCCKIVPTYPLFSVDQIKLQFESYIEQGYEGQMIRIDAPYQNKRSKYLLKDKVFNTEEFEIIGVEEGVGKLKGKVGNLLIRVNNLEVKSSVNGDHEYLEKLFKDNNLIGKMATIRFFNYTPEGSLRFPKCICIRDFE